MVANPAVHAWSTVFVALCVQATPYLVLGVLVSTAIAVFVPPRLFAAALPRRPALAVPVAAVAGAALPGCECGSIPVAAALLRRGVPSGPAAAFLLAAPAVNPLVLVATSVAYPGRPAIVFARFTASLVTAVTTGCLWQRAGPSLPRVRSQLPVDDGPAWRRATSGFAADLTQALGLLVVGAAAAALVNVAVPRRWLDLLGGSAVAGVFVLAALAVMLAVCSEADAFIAASLTQFSRTAQLTFMVVGPAVDLKLVAMQAGTFGGRFTLRFAPLTLGVAIASAGAVGAVLL